MKVFYLQIYFFDVSVIIIIIAIIFFYDILCWQ